MDVARWSSLVALDAAYRDGATHLPAGPLELYVEVAARCNLRCRMCPITVDPRYQPQSGGPGLFPEELFERLEPLLPTLRRVYLQGLGEPTLHPRLVDFTARLATAGVEVWVTTNGTLVDEALAESLARGLARVTVSLDGATAATYERVRVRGRFADLRRGLLALGAARRRHGRPALHLSLIGMASNLHELEALVDLCAEVGGDGVSLEALYAWEHPDLEAFAAEEHLGHLAPARVAALVEGARRRAERLGLAFWSRIEDIGAAALAAPPPGPAEASGATARHATDTTEPGTAPAPEPSLPFACSEPWSTAVVNARGEVRTCCFNDEVLGSIHDAPLDAIWNAAPYRELRRRQAAGEVPASCARCVASGRVKRSGVLTWQATVPEEERSRGEHLLRAPLDGELVRDELVLFGTLPEAAPWWRGGRAAPAAALPELFVNGLLVARLGDCAIAARGRFAAVVPIGFVTPGAHEVTLRSAPGRGGALLARRYVQVARPELPLGGIAAVHTVALPLPLSRREDCPQVLLDGVRRPLASWLCRPYGDGWLGAALIDLRGVPAGEHRLKLRFRHHAPEARELWRIAPL